MPFAGELGVQVHDANKDEVRGALDWRADLCTAGGVLHGGALMAFADSLGALCAFLNLPEGATGFTTIELKTNFVRSVQEGTVDCVAQLVHGGRTTQIWDATVTDADGLRMALFRCTQLILR